MREAEIGYNGNTYDDLFFYPKPTEDKTELEMAHYETCKDYMDDNADIPYTQQGTKRHLKMHTCFPQCKTNADCYLGYNVDTREKCLVGEITGKGEEEGILCV